ncbi:VOC family protein [Kitasatospora sp. DSM 101779]|uniref:VOC family protein n=1 Tax=Kitasatospora sp. DSM 101779 TaxID=2853165 RepID=UPI0021D9CD7F|nr:VOC family protein [Kitasatospora sp. DSM 101779]MCU7825328.1 VOC family protein [Kitasatospora sp. DSM 101779]
MLTTEFRTGSPCWLDLGSPDIPATAGFYGTVFGWTFQSLGEEAGNYGFFQQEGRTVAAVGPLTEEGSSPAWTLYFRTPDADATAKAAEQHGGTVRAEPFDVMSNGRMAQLSDPAGVQFAIWQAGETQGLDAVTDANTFCWAELHTADPAAATAFYQALFGWRTETVEMPGMAYTVYSTAEGGSERETSFGGVAPLQSPDEPVRWVPYFEVTEVDAVLARAEHAGGQVVMPGMDVPGVGRLGWATDPHGAVFAIIKSDMT